MPTAYFKRLNKAKAAWDNQKNNSKNDLDTALFLFTQYSENGGKRFIHGRWNTHHAKDIRTAINTFEDRTVAEQDLAHLLNDVVTTLNGKSVNHTGSLSAIVHTIVMNWKPANNFDNQINDVFGPGLSKKEALKQLKRYSANGFVRFFRGELGNKHVGLVRTVLKNFDEKTGTVEQLFQELEDSLQNNNVTPKLNSPLDRLIKDYKKLAVKPKAVRPRRSRTGRRPSPRQHDQQADTTAQAEAQRLAQQEQQHQAELRAQQEQQRQAELRAQQEQQRQTELRAQQEQQRQAELRAQQEQQRQAELRAAQQEQQRQTELRAAQQEQQRQAELRAAQQEQQRQAELRAAQQEQQRQAELRAAQQEQQRTQAQKPKTPSRESMSYKEQKKYDVRQKQAELKEHVNELAELKKWVDDTDPIAGCYSRSELLRNIEKNLKEAREVIGKEDWRVVMSLENNITYIITPSVAVTTQISSIKKLQVTHENEVAKIQEPLSKLKEKNQEFENKCKILEKPAAELSLTEAQKGKHQQEIMTLKQKISTILNAPVASLWNKTRDIENLMYYLGSSENSLNSLAKSHERYKQRAHEKRERMSKSYNDAISSFDDTSKKLHTYLCVMLVRANMITQKTQDNTITNFKKVLANKAQLPTAPISDGLISKIKSEKSNLMKIFNSLCGLKALKQHINSAEIGASNATDKYFKLHETNFNKFIELLKEHQSHLTEDLKLCNNAPENEATVEKALHIITKLLQTKSLDTIKLDQETIQQFNTIRNAKKIIKAIKASIKREHQQAELIREKLRACKQSLQTAKELLTENPFKILGIDDGSKQAHLGELTALQQSLDQLIEKTDGELLQNDGEIALTAARKQLEEKIKPIEERRELNLQSVVKLRKRLRNIDQEKSLKSLSAKNYSNYDLNGATLSSLNYDHQLDLIKTKANELIKLDDTALFIQKDKVDELKANLKASQEKLKKFVTEAKQLKNDLTEIEVEHSNMAYRTNSYIKLLDLIPDVDASVKNVILGSLQKRAALVVDTKSKLDTYPALSYTLLGAFKINLEICKEVSEAVKMYPEMAQHMACVEQSAVNVLAGECANATYHKLAHQGNGLATAETATIAKINTFCKKQDHLLETAFGKQQPPAPPSPPVNYNYVYVEWADPAQIQAKMKARWARYAEEEQRKQREEEARERRETHLRMMRATLINKVVAQVKYENPRWDEWTTDAQLKSQAKQQIEQAAKSKQVISLNSLASNVEDYDIMPALEKEERLEQERIAEEEANEVYHFNYA